MFGKIAFWRSRSKPVNADQEPQLAAWVYLPAGAETGAIAPSSFNFTANHTANAGEWLLFYTGQKPMVAGEYLLVQSINLLADNGDAYSVRMSDNGAGPNLQVNVVKYVSSPPGPGVPGWFITNETGVTIMLWRLPKQT